MIHTLMNKPYEYEAGKKLQKNYQQATNIQIIIK